MLVSAPYPDSIREDADRLLQDPAMVKVETPHDDNQIEQHFYEVDDARRFEAAAPLLRHFRPESALVFCNTRAACAALASYLRRPGFSALARHSETDQGDRDDVDTKWAGLGTCGAERGDLGWG